MAIFGKQLTITPRRVGTLQAATPGGPDQAPTGAPTLDNVLKLIPGEVVPLFIAGRGIAVDLPPAQWTAVIFWTCLALCVVLRIAASKPVGAPLLSPAGVNWPLVGVTGLAFFIWAHAVSDTGPVVAAFHGPLAGFFAMVFGILAPVLVRPSQG
jgi:hypothetical protein